MLHRHRIYGQGFLSGPGPGPKPPAGYDSEDSKNEYSASEAFNIVSKTAEGAKDPIVKAILNDAARQIRRLQA